MIPATLLAPFLRSHYIRSFISPLTKRFLHSTMSAASKPQPKCTEPLEVCLCIDH